MVSTAARAEPTVAAASPTLAQAGFAAAFGSLSALRRAFIRAVLAASASKALDSPRNAFCASNGMRCTTKDSCSAGAACGAPARDISVSIAAAARQSTMSAISTGRSPGLDILVSRVVISFIRRKRQLAACKKL